VALELLKALTTRPSATQNVRTAVRVALAAHKTKADALAEVKAGLVRARAAIDAAPLASQAAESANKAAKQAAREWAAAGAVDAADSPHRIAIARATEAQRLASDAQLLADGAAKAIPELEESVAAAEQEVSNAQVAVRAAIGPVLLEYAKPYAARLHRIVGSLRNALPELRSVVAEIRAIETASKECGPAGKYFGNENLNQHFEPMLVDLRDFRELFNSVCSDRSLAEGITSWQQLVQRLQVHPDAALGNGGDG
jgi:hypothetical protein